MLKAWRQHRLVAALKRQRKRKEELVQREIHDAEELKIALERIKQEYLDAFDRLVRIDG